jgi:hypothetical protein
MALLNLLNPLAFLFALIAVPIILLYLLRLQRREQTVSSTLLWRQITLDREANTLWQRLRRNLLLLLQLLTLAFFVFALIRPYISVPSVISGKLVVLLDASASMRANDILPSRFDAAKVEARNLISQLGTEDQMALIIVDGSPRALSALTNDKQQLSGAVDEAQPSLEAANWSAAISLAAATTANTTDSTIFVISDGANADDLKLIQGNARFIPIGASDDNIAFTTLSLRRTIRGLAAFARVSNTGSKNDRVLVSLKADRELVDARTVEVAAGKSAEFVVGDLNPNTSSIEAKIDQAEFNKLATDDVAFAVNASNATRSALLLTRGNRFLEQAMNTLPGLRVTRAVTVPLDNRRYDLYVLDSLTMTLPANANVLLVGSQPYFETSGVFSDTDYVRTETHPITQQVDWRNVNVLDARRVNPPSWLRPVIESQGGALVWAGENNVVGDLDTIPIQRAVYLPFELRKSDLPLQIAFPILIANAVDWLAPPQGLNTPTNPKPREVIAMPEGAQVTLPDNQIVTTEKRGFTRTDQVGVYRFKLGQVEGAFAVNFLNPSESQIAPNRAMQIGTGSTQNATENQTLSQREFWGWLAAGSLLILLAEWWIYQRGVPRFGKR